MVEATRKISNVDSFGSFLESVKTSNEPATSEVTQIDITDTANTAKSILSGLSEKTSPILVGELLVEIGGTITAVAQTLKTLEDSNLVNLQQIDNQQVVELTDIGKQLAKLSSKLTC